MSQIKNKAYLNNRLAKLMVSPEEKLNKAKNLTEENKEKLLSLKDKHKGERCFIIGSSPSLKMLDLTKLNNEITFTVNRGYKLKEQGLNNSTYHIMSDNMTLKDDNVKEELSKDFTRQFLIYGGIDFPIKENIIYFDYMTDVNNEKSLCEDISKPFLACGTIIAYALQFAYFMDFKEIYIIGVDLDFKNQIGHAYQETQGEKQRQEEHSCNYEHIMLKGLNNIIKQMLDAGINVKNASFTGMLNCIARVKYDTLFKE